MQLADFQKQTIANLNDAMANDKQEIVLKSPTGSGKTIMLTYFMDEYCKSTPNIVFIWLTPGKGNLEEQSKAKMDIYVHNSQTKLLSDVMTSGFSENDCCFINWEKLTKRGNNALKEGERKNFLEHIETAKTNGLQFKVIVDESHQNDSVKANEILEYFQTDKIIRASATPKNFNKNTCSFIEVPEPDVIAAGLIKKLLVINEDFSQSENISDQISFLLDKALEKQRELHSAFLQRQCNINPLIVVQLPNKNEVLLDDVETYFESKQITYENGLLAVWLSNKKENLDFIENNDATPIVVIIKQAVATGWDCPRAHILVKLRDNMSEVFEIQTIGRIRRMPEAKHYGCDLLDRCYLYTLDEKFTEGVQNSLGKGALNAIKLFLKHERKQFTIKGEYKSDLSATQQDSQQALIAIAQYIRTKYSVTNNYQANQSLLEANKYVFSKDVVKHTVSGDIKTLQAHEFSTLNDIKLHEQLDTHTHGREFHHHVADIGLKIGLSYDQINIIVRRLFGKKDKYSNRILDLDIRELYAFILNNSDKLKQDIQGAMSNPTNKSPKLNKNQITEFDFHIPQETIFTFDANSKSQSVSNKNVYKGYLDSAEPRSTSEKLFEKFCEECNAVDWIYKNGDKGNEYLSIVYNDNFGKQKSFYPDYIVGMLNGETWIIETKGGFSRTGESEDIDKFSSKKFDVLKQYINKHNLKGGFVRQDKQSQELCICTQHYSDDIQSNDWALLKVEWSQIKTQWTQDEISFSIAAQDTEKYSTK